MYYINRLIIYIMYSLINHSYQYELIDRSNAVKLLYYAMYEHSLSHVMNDHLLSCHVFYHLFYV